MGLLSAKQAIETKFNTDWTYTSIAWPNVEFDPRPLTEWVRLSIITGGSNQASAGGTTNFYRTKGVVVIQIFVEPNSGAKRALELADYAISIWRSLQLGSIVFMSPYTTTVGVNDGWYQVNVSCDFHVDEIV